MTDLLELVDDDDRWAEITDEWDVMAERDGHPFLWSHAWFDAWRSSFAPAEALSVVTVRRDGHLTAAMPATSTARRFRSMANPHGVLLRPIGIDGSARATVCDGMLGCGFRRIHLPRFPAIGPEGRDLVAELKAKADSGHRVVVRAQDPRTLVRMDGGFDEYCEKQLSKKARKSLRNAANRLQKLGGEHTLLCRPAPDNLSVVEECLELELATWKGEQGSAVLSRPETARFYRAIVAMLAEQGALVVSVTRIDGAVAAFELGAVENATYFALKVGFDDAYARASPGNVLALATLEAAADAGIRTADFGSGGSSRLAKRMFATGSEQLVDATIFGPHPGARITGLLVDRSWQARRRLAQSTPLRRLLGKEPIP